MDLFLIYIAYATQSSQDLSVSLEVYILDIPINPYKMDERVNYKALGQKARTRKRDWCVFSIESTAIKKYKIDKERESDDK